MAYIQHNSPFKQKGNSWSGYSVDDLIKSAQEGAEAKKWLDSASTAIGKRRELKRQRALATTPTVPPSPTLGDKIKSGVKSYANWIKRGGVAGDLYRKIDTPEERTAIKNTLVNKAKGFISRIT